MTRLDDAREVPITHVVEDILGLHRESGRANGITAYFCPFHTDEKTPSLIAMPNINKVMCCAGCVISSNGKSTASGVDLVMRYYGVPMSDAIDRILGGAGQPTKPPPQRPRQTVNTRTVSMREVMSHAAGLGLVMPYLKKRGISESIAKRLRLGGTLSHSNAPIRWPDGSTTTIAPVQRLIIPYFWGDEVKNLVARMDEIDAMNRWLSLGSPWKEKIHLLKGYTVKEMIDFVFGGRYRSYPKSPSNTLYLEPLFRREVGGVIVQPEMPVAFLMEGQLDAITMLDSGRLMAGSSTGVPDLKEIMAKVETVFFVRDNDKEKVDPQTGEIYTPGQRLSERLRNNSGRTEGHDWITVLPAEGCKDANDMAVKGVLQDWIRDIGVHVYQRKELPV